VVEFSHSRRASPLSTPGDSACCSGGVAPYTSENCLLEYNIEQTGATETFIPFLVWVVLTTEGFFLSRIRVTFGTNYRLLASAQESAPLLSM
jgi:hypothetical protein